MSPKATKHCVAHPTSVIKVMTHGLPRKPDARFVLDLTVVNSKTQSIGTKRSQRVKTQVTVTSKVTEDPRQKAQQVPFT